MSKTTEKLREIVARLALESADALTAYYASRDIDREALATYEALRFVLDTILRAHARHEAKLVECPASFLRETDASPAIGREFAVRLRLLALADEIDNATAPERTSKSKAFVISTKMSNGTTSRPTREQIEQARAWFTEGQLDAMVEDEYEETARHVRTLLAATEEPSEEDLAEEAARAVNARLDFGEEIDDVVLFNAKRAMAGEFEGEVWYDAVRLYIAGARREGRR